MKIDVYNPYSNVAVTEYYIEIIANALRRQGHLINKATELVYSTENECIIVVYPYDCYRAHKAGYKKIILWIQGVSPEESYMRNHSIIRYLFLSMKEYMGLRKADYVIMVSTKMRQHYEKKYHRPINVPIFYMPCFNSELDKDAFFTPEKYSQNVFCYAGGLAVWQCFQETVALYRKIEDRLENARFEVYTPDIDQAKQVLIDYGVKHYSVEYVTQSELANRMRKVKYGFVLRHDTTVNRVATPTKFSSYMSSGVIPIFTCCIDDFYKATKDISNIVALDSLDVESGYKKIIKMSQRSVSADEVYSEYKKLFDTYYNPLEYEKKLASFIRLE